MKEPLIYTTNKYLPLVALCLGFFMVIIDVTIVNVALPNMATDLKGDVSWLQWVVDGYTLTFAGLLLSAGNLGDRVGAKSTFLLGLVLFVLTSLGCGFSSNFWQLTIFRLLQGISAALLVPTSLALISASYENKQERAHAIGIWATVGGIAAAAGPVLGGLLTSWFNWRAVFFVNLPFGIAGFLLTKKYVPNPVSHKAGSFDFFGQLFGIISIAALAFGLIEVGRLSWNSNSVLIAFLIFVITFIAFLIVEQRVTHPMFPLNFFHSKTFSIAIAIGMILNISVYGELFVLTFYFQHIRDYSVIMTGFAFIPLVGVTAMSSYLGGKMTSKIGEKKPIIIGLTVSAVGFLLMLIAKEHSSYLVMVIPLAAIGFGIAFTMPAATVAVIHSVPHGCAGIASGALNASRQIGSLIGVALFGTIINRSSYFISGMHITLLISGLALLGGMAAVLLGLGEV